MYSLDGSSPFALDMNATAFELGSPAVFYGHPQRIHVIDAATGNAEDPFYGIVERAGFVRMFDYAGWAEPNPAIRARLTVATGHLLVHDVSGEVWYTGTLPTNRRWRDAVRAAGQLIHVTAPVPNRVGWTEIDDPNHRVEVCRVAPSTLTIVE